ncbi:MAG TPA: DUF2752 domain-containing protein [Clostridiales bacterium]|nr:DUF2752 domain-containing protein [Clostridiales bacterium]
MAEGEHDLKQRLRKRTRLYLAVLFSGLAYLLWVGSTGLGIPCPIRLFTGLKCPGCGITTMFVHLAKGDLSVAFEANPFILVTLPFLVAEIVFCEICYFKPSLRGKTVSKINNGILVVYTVALILFGVLRNLPFTSLP